MEAQSNTYSAQDNLDNTNVIKTYLLDPLKSGILGFATFFSIILITTIIGYMLGFQESFNIGLSDVIYALTGFVFVAGSKFIGFFSNE